MVWLSTSVALIGCASTRAPAPPGPNGAPPADAILAGCQRVAEGSGAVRYDCRGFSAVAEDARDDPAGDPDSDVDELVAGVVKEFGPLRDKLGARVRVEKSVLEVGGRAAHAAKVSADDPATAGRYRRVRLRDRLGTPPPRLHHQRGRRDRELRARDARAPRARDPVGRAVTPRRARAIAGAGSSGARRAAGCR